MSTIPLSFCSRTIAAKVVEKGATIDTANDSYNSQHVVSFELISLGFFRTFEFIRVIVV